MEEGELFHEAWVWFGEGSGLADGCEDGFGGGVGLGGEEVGDEEGCGAGFAHGTGDEVSISERRYRDVSWH